jgi:hypothetical protein
VHHLDITLKLVPGSPSIVGTVVAFGGTQLQSMHPITAKGKCVVAGGGSICPVGVRVPLGFRGSGEIVFGRAARPGEQYVSGGSPTAPGEAMHGLRYRGRRVATVLALLRARHVTVPAVSLRSRELRPRAPLRSGAERLVRPQRRPLGPVRSCCSSVQLRSGPDARLDLCGVVGVPSCTTSPEPRRRTRRCPLNLPCCDASSKASECPALR